MSSDNTIYHMHHVVPKHMGGSDDASNLIKLTIEEHAEAHRKLYEEHGHWEDKLAWKALSGQISKAEIAQEMRREAMKERWTEEARAEQSKAVSGENNPQWGKPTSAAQKEAVRKANSVPKPHLSKLYKERVAKGEMSNPVMYGEANPKSKRVSVLGVEYASGLSADKALGLTPQSTTYRCNSQSKKWIDWYFV